MTHKQHLCGLEAEEKSNHHMGRHGGSGTHRSRKRGFRLKDVIPWHFIVGVLVGLAAAWLVSILFVNKLV